MGLKHFKPHELIPQHQAQKFQRERSELFSSPSKFYILILYSCPFRHFQLSSQIYCLSAKTETDVDVSEPLSDSRQFPQSAFAEAGHQRRKNVHIFSATESLRLQHPTIKDFSWHRTTDCRACLLSLKYLKLQNQADVEDQQKVLITHKCDSKHQTSKKRHKVLSLNSYYRYNWRLFDTEANHNTKTHLLPITGILKCTKLSYI